MIVQILKKNKCRSGVYRSAYGRSAFFLLKVIFACQEKIVMVKFPDIQHIIVTSLKFKHNSQRVEKDLQKMQLTWQNISDPDKTILLEQYNLGLHCLLWPICQEIDKVAHPRTLKHLNIPLPELEARRTIILNCMNSWLLSPVILCQKC